MYANMGKFTRIQMAIHVIPHLVLNPFPSQTETWLIVFIAFVLCSWQLQLRNCIWVSFPCCRKARSSCFFCVSLSFQIVFCCDLSLWIKYIHWCQFFIPQIDGPAHLLIGSLSQKMTMRSAQTTWAPAFWCSTQKRRDLCTEGNVLVSQLWLYIQWHMAVAVLVSWLLLLPMQYTLHSVPFMDLSRFIRSTWSVNDRSSHSLQDTV